MSKRENIAGVAAVSNYKPHSQADQGPCPGVGLWAYFKRCSTTGGV